MTHAWQIVRDVLDKFRGLPVKLAAMNGESAEWYRSHGREPKNLNPDAGGNVSAVEHYMRYARKCEAGATGAGLMLNHRVYGALSEEFVGITADDVDQADLEINVIDETCDVQKWLVKFDIDAAERRDLVYFVDQCKQATEQIMSAETRAVLRLKELAMERDQAFETMRNGSK